MLLRNILCMQYSYGSWDNLVGIENRLRSGRPRNRSSNPCRGKRFSSSPKRSDWLWNPPSLLLNGFHGFFPLGLIGCGVKLTTLPNFVLKLKIGGVIFHCHIRLHGVRRYTFTFATVLCTLD